MFSRFKIRFINGINIIKNEGLLSFLLKLKNFLRRKLNIPDNSPVSVNELLDSHFFSASPIPSLYVKSTSLRLNVVIDTLLESALFGGTATSIIFSMMLANRLQCPLRVITRDEGGNVKNPTGFYAIAKAHHITVPPECTFVCIPFDAVKTKKSALDISEQDLFISTSWWSSKAVQKINLRKKYIYLLQEHEKIFYPNGDEHIMIDEIFNDSKMIPLVNTTPLFQYFIDNDYPHIKENGLCFEPAFPYVALPDKEKFHQTKEKLDLLFFARPTTARNLFYKGLNLIDSAIDLGIIESQKWNIFFAGAENYPRIKFSDNSKPHVLKKMLLPEYASFIQNMDLGIGLLLAPCSGYVPLDLACAGAAVLTTAYKNKISLEQYSKNIICAAPTKESLLKHLEEAVRLSENREKRYTHLLNQQINRNWENTFSHILDVFIDRIDKNLM